ncbi:pilus assembly protein [Planctomycetota bacterium]|nr:pilus assembly protein [Planctomycetota bacterium]
MPGQEMIDRVEYQWWDPLLNSSGGWWYAVGVLTVLLLIMVMLRGMYRLHRFTVEAKSRSVSGENGSATVEFLMVFPILLFLVLLLLQLMFLLTGNIYVHYAAYAAARSAIVYIPADLGDGTIPNSIVTVKGFEKYDAIHDAAYLAMIPVSGQRDSLPADVDIDVDEYVQALNEHYVLMGHSAPPWVETLIPGRVMYAAAHTRVEVLKMVAPVGVDDFYDGLEIVKGTHTYGPHDPVGVLVKHDFNLGVPYVRALFADGRLEDASGDGAYASIVGHALLVNEGIRTELPPMPSLKRELTNNYLWSYIARN